MLYGDPPRSAGVAGARRLPRCASTCRSASNGSRTSCAGSASGPRTSGSCFAVSSGNGKQSVIAAIDALERLREGNRRFVASQAIRSSAGSGVRRTDPVARPGTVRDHPRLLGLAGARRARVRSGLRRPVRDPRRRQHRGALADRQRGVRRGALRHAARRRARPLAVRRHHRDARRAARDATTSNRRNLRSIVDRVRPAVETRARDGPHCETPRR